MSGEKHINNGAEAYKQRQADLKDLFSQVEQRRESGRTQRSSWLGRSNNGEERVFKGFSTKFIGEYDNGMGGGQVEVLLFTHSDGLSARITGSEMNPVFVTKHSVYGAREPRYTSSSVSEDIVYTTHMLVPESGLVPDEEAMDAYEKKMRRFSYGTNNGSTHK